MKDIGLGDILVTNNGHTFMVVKSKQTSKYTVVILSGSTIYNNSLSLIEKDTIEELMEELEYVHGNVVKILKEKDIIISCKSNNNNGEKMENMDKIEKQSIREAYELNNQTVEKNSKINIGFSHKIKTKTLLKQGDVVLIQGEENTKSGLYIYEIISNRVVFISLSKPSYPNLITTDSANAEIRVNDKIMCNNYIIKSICDIDIIVKDKGSFL